LFSEFLGEEPDLMTQRLHKDIEDGIAVDCVEATSSSAAWRF